MKALLIRKAVDKDTEYFVVKGLIPMHSAEDYIIEMFKNSKIIGLGEGGHHLENAHQFFQKMFENKKIQEIIDIVILEFANASYQR